MTQIWWELSVSGTQIENIMSSIAPSDGSTIQGVQCDSESSGKVFVVTDGNEPQEIIDTLVNSGASVSSSKIDTSYDWQGHVQKSWEPFAMGSFTVVPIVDPSSHSPSQSNAHTIYLVPGSGFGTGHSLTTQSTLALLEQLKAGGSFKPKTILDVGTGSGILALCATKLFSVSVDAMDVSELAIANAKENCQLNGLESAITVSVGSTLFINQTYDLIIANIEIGIQLDLFAEYNRLSEKGGYLILGGLRDQIRGEQIEQLLNSSGTLSESDSLSWRLTSHETMGEWSAFIFQRLFTQKTAKFLP
jgi:ribosomal protein L11 methylase PrmA